MGKSMDQRDGVTVEEGPGSLVSGDDADLARLGYKSEFKREFTNLGTISFAFSIMGLCSSVTTTFDTPMLYGGGPASAVWCWFIGACMCFTLGTSIAELVSAYPTSGGLYSASAFLVPKRHRSWVGYLVGWLNLLGQIAGVASTEFGLSRMIWAAYAVSKDGDFVPSNVQLVGLYAGLLVIHGLINSLATKALAYITQFFVFFNLAGTLAIIIALLATTDNKHSAGYTFGQTYNTTGWSSDGLAFLFGLLSVQWTMTGASLMQACALACRTYNSFNVDYDATAHISEEVKRAAVAAPVAIFVAVIGTGLLGWILNIVLVLCSGDITTLPGPAGLSVATILSSNVGKGGFYAIWFFVCCTSFFVVSTAMQANSRSFFAFSRDAGLPDWGVFGKLAKNKVPINGVWIVVMVSILLGLLQFASAVAVNAIFSLCTMALDSSYAIPIACKLIFMDHPEVQFKPGPFNLGRGPLMWIFNLCAVFWTGLVIVILALPTIRPVTSTNMNYASVITGGVAFLAALWYIIQARHYYTGPRSNLNEEEVVDPTKLSPKPKKNVKSASTTAAAAAAPRRAESSSSSRSGGKR